MTTGKRLPFAEVNAAALADLAGLLDTLRVRFRKAGYELQMINPRRTDDGFGSFSVNETTGVWSDFATGDKGGDPVSLVAYLEGIEQGAACKLLMEKCRIGQPGAAPVPAPKRQPAADTLAPVIPIPADWLGRMPKTRYKHPGRVVQWWRYNDAAGLPLVFVARLEPGQNGRSKDYFPCSVWRDSASGEVKWMWKNLAAPRPLYQLDQLAVRPDAPVVICEGEKAADAAATLFPDHVATTWMNGAEAVGKADFFPLAGRVCLFWPDNDAAGNQALAALPARLAAAGVASLAVIDRTAFAAFAPSGDARGRAILADGGQWQEGDDAVDAVAYGWTAGHIDALRAAGRLVLADAGADDGDGQAVTRDESEEGRASAPSSSATAASASEAGKETKPARKPRKPATSGGAGVSGNPFKVTDSGVYFQTEDMESALWICARLDILAMTRDKDGGGWGTLVRFADPDGTVKEWNIPNELLAGDTGGEVLKGLLSMGLRIGSGPKAKQRLLEYLQRYDGGERATIVGRLGWHDGSFLLPDVCLGNAPSKLVYQGAGKQREVMQSAGTLADWQDGIGRYCVGNSRLAFAVSTAFAGPLLDVIGAESGGFHFYGDSSQGKTTLLQVAASVFGGPGYLQTWRATDNALEAIAAAYSDCLLALDEIHQCDPRIIGETVYMLGNGRGKARANDKGGSRGSVAEWRVLFLSSGEKTLAAHMAEARKELKAGMEIRLLAVRADVDGGHGLFDTLHDQPSGKALADHLKAGVARCYGSPALAYLDKLVQERGEVAGKVLALGKRFADEVLPPGAHGQAHRAASRFALVAAAGELASAWGVTGWPKGAAWSAAKTCFADWLAARGTVGNVEDEEILGKVRLFFEQHGEARFSRLLPESEAGDYNPDDTAPQIDHHAPKTMSRCGWRLNSKIEGMTRYYVMKDSFRREVCAGLDVARVCRLLKSAGALEHNRGNMYQWRNPEAGGSRMDVYCVTSRLFGGGDDERA